MLPVLYSFRRCPYAMRARLALAASAQPHELREVVLKSKPPELMQASPKGTVPVLVLPDGQVIDQSLDIMLWALQQNDPSGWLTPQQTTLADMLKLVAECDGGFKAALDRYKYPQRYEAADPHRQRSDGVLWLRQLEARLSVQPYLAGADPSLSDAAIMPFVRQFAQVDLAWFNRQPLPSVQAWLQGWLASPLFEAVMQRHDPWREGPGVTYPRSAAA